MPNWNHIVRQHLAVLRLPSEREIEIVEEQALHLEATYEDALADGLSEAEAEARALRSYDWRLLECELSRAERPGAKQALQPSLELIEQRGGIRMESLIQDVRFGARMLLKNSGFTIVAVLSLALGIGANTAIFSLVDQALLRPLPVEKPEQLVTLAATTGSLSLSVFTYPDYAEYRDRNEVFSGLVAYFKTPFSLSDGGQTERLYGLMVSGNYFSMLGVNPAPFLPLFQRYQPAVSLHVRTAGNPAEMVAAIRREVQALDPGLPVFNIKTLEEQKSRSLYTSRMAALLLSFFGLLALLLAGIGLYGVMAYSVNRRTRETGIRMALGAQSYDVLRMVVSQGMRLTLIGVGLGLAAALALTRVMKNLLFNVSAAESSGSPDSLAQTPSW